MVCDFIIFTVRICGEVMLSIMSVCQSVSLSVCLSVHWVKGPHVTITNNAIASVLPQTYGPVQTCSPGTSSTTWTYSNLFTWAPPKYYYWQVAVGL